MPKLKTLTIIPIGAAILGACIIVDADGDGHSFHAETQWGLEKLMALNISGDALQVQMASNGCTTKDTVDANVDQDGKNQYEIAIERTKEDMCRGYFPDGKSITWTYDELGIPAGAQVRVINKVQSKVG